MSKFRPTGDARRTRRRPTDDPVGDLPIPIFGVVGDYYFGASASSSSRRGGNLVNNAIDDTTTTTTKPLSGMIRGYHAAEEDVEFRRGVTERGNWRDSHHGGEEGMRRGVDESQLLHGVMSSGVVDRNHDVVRTMGPSRRRRRWGGDDDDYERYNDGFGSFDVARLLRLVVVVVVVAMAALIATHAIGGEGERLFVIAPLLARLALSSSRHGMAGDDGGGRRRALLELVGVRGREGLGGGDDDDDIGYREPSSSIPRPSFVLDRPYATSSYYAATSNVDLLSKMGKAITMMRSDAYRRKKEGATMSNRLAILRPFGDFDAIDLPATFDRWNSFVPCRAAEMDLGDDIDENEGTGGREGEVGVVDEWVIFDVSMNGTGPRLDGGEEGMWECDDNSTSSSSSPWPTTRRCRRKRPVGGMREHFDGVPAYRLRTTSADLFLLYSRTYTENGNAVNAVDAIMKEFFSPGGWSRCFDNVYAVEAGISKELDLYIPEAQSELLNWVNGPNRAYGAGYRIVQSGEWGNYDAFYLMEGESVPVKNYWLDVIHGEVNAHRPFAVLGSRYDGDRWDGFYESVPVSLLHHVNGNGIYNISHPLLERIVGQLEVEATSPYNSIPYDYRMSQIWTEGTLGIVPKLAPKIMLNEKGENITLSDNLEMFSSWADRWKDEEPYKNTMAIHNYAATNILPRHLGLEYVIHGAKLYSPWDPTRMEITLVVSEWFYDRSLSLIKDLDDKDHPFSGVIIMIPESVSNSHDYSKYTSVPVTLQYRRAPDFMDLCAAEVTTDWFMITNSYHQVSRHVDLMFTVSWT